MEVSKADQETFHGELNLKFALEAEKNLYFQVENSEFKALKKAIRLSVVSVILRYQVPAIT